MDRKARLLANSKAQTPPLSAGLSAQPGEMLSPNPYVYSTPATSNPAPMLQTKGATTTTAQQRASQHSHGTRQRLSQQPISSRTAKAVNPGASQQSPPPQECILPKSHYIGAGAAPPSPTTGASKAVGTPGHLASPTEQMSAVQAKAASTRNKNEEAISDLRKRIPEIENIFDIHNRIGNGTFSTVLLGTLKKERELADNQKRKFAIKHHIPTSHPDRIMKELQCMAKIGGSNNVVGINCCIRYNESVAFIMPYLAHDRFHDFYSRMDVAEVQYYMKNLLIALRHVHQFNVIHRDVKPSNFLYNRRKRQFLLVDFGLAQQVASSQLGLSSKGMHTATPPSIMQSEGKRSRELDESSKKGAESGEIAVAVSGGGEVISGVAKRLKCTGPERQADVCSNTRASGGNDGLKATLTISAVGNGNSTTAAEPKYNTNRNLTNNSGPKCYCYGNPQVCNICLVKKEIHASRAGTPGYRPPEVLLKYPDQTTAVDIWAVGVIFLSVLSSVYPFFKAPNDYVALAEMVTVFGDKTIRKTAFILDRLVTLSQKTKPLDLRKLCVRFRNRAKFSSQELLKKYQQRDGTCEVCKNCDQFYFNCLCKETNFMTEPVEADDIFPPSAYDLLYKLLEVNPHKRITADDALKHEFFQECHNNNNLSTSVSTPTKAASPAISSTAAAGDSVKK